MITVRTFRNIGTLFAILLFSLGIATIANADQPGGTGKHFELNVIGFANCTMTTDGVYPDCFKGNDQPGGHVIKVPLKTSQTENICETSPIADIDPLTPGVQVGLAALQKGVRILVTDSLSDQLQVVDSDATDGTARFNLPDGCYEIFAAAAGKPGGCMDVDTITCFDEVSLGVFEQVDCQADLSNDRFVQVGHIDVDRTTGKPKWDNVTSDLLPVETGVGTGDPGYFDFFWQIYNKYVRIMKLRIVEVACAQ